PCFMSFSSVLFLIGSGILSGMESFGPISPDFYFSLTTGFGAFDSPLFLC
ncbi:hypothetical protein HMPREF1986_02067, partial [Oribacterium sp. oral taxon 078 str. F0263]